MLSLDEAWEELESSEYEQGVTTVTAELCRLHSDRMRSIFEFLIPFLNRNYVGQRAVATAIFSAFIPFAGDDLPLLRKNINSLLPRVADKHERVRKQALLGLGNLVQVWSSDVSQAASSVLSALVSAMEDVSGLVASQAVESMIQIVEVVDVETMTPMLVNVCFRMRPAFDRPESDIRASAFRLFGSLCRFSAGSSAENFEDQCQTNLPIFIAHLGDEEEAVRQACLEALRLLVAQLGHADMCGALEECSASPYEYDGFLEGFVPLMVQHYERNVGSYLQNTTGYFKSEWMCIRGNCAIFMGLLLAHVPAAGRKRIDLSSSCRALVELLKQNSTLVRCKASKALSYLHDV